jgi:hypothetical protein
MTDHRQTDLFGASQPDLFGSVPQHDLRPDPAEVRAKLHLVLGKARAAPAMPWSRKDIEFYKVVFPQMTCWLPDDEARQLRFEFAMELDRLAAA